MSDCPICTRGAPLDVIAELDATWAHEIHGNTIPHVHMHLFPRFAGDPYVGVPIDPRAASFARSSEELARLGAAIAASF